MLEPASSVVVTVCGGGVVVVGGEGVVGQHFVLGLRAQLGFLILQ